MARPINVLGGRFNRVRVLSRAGSDQGGALWNCVCDCGNWSNQALTYEPAAEVA